MGAPIVTGDSPQSLAVGDGSLWVANHDAESVSRIDLKTDQVVATIKVHSEPHRIAYGEGAVWVALWHEQSVARIDPKTNQVMGEPIPIGYTAGAIAAGEGAVWVTSDYRPDSPFDQMVLVRIDPRTNAAVETIPLGGHPTDVVVGASAIWVTRAKPDAVLRIKP